MFSFGFEQRGKTVQDQVAIEFTQNAYIETRHSVISYSNRSTWTSRSMREISSRIMRPGSAARQFAAPQAVANAKLCSKESSFAAAKANPAKAASPQPTVDIATSGVVQA